MVKHWAIISLLGIFVTVASPGFAQKTTELFIPLGQSPGLSGKHTLIGKIDQVNPMNNTLTVTDAAGTYPVPVTPGTRIYLDRSQARLPNTQGTLADCRPGDAIEVKFVDNARTQPAEWIKVRKAP